MRYQDAIAIVRELGRPSAFVTMTCNPRWSEVARRARVAHLWTRRASSEA